jgi:hypothetical protein
MIFSWDTRTFVFGLLDRRRGCMSPSLREQDAVDRADIQVAGGRRQAARRDGAGEGGADGGWYDDAVMCLGLVGGCVCFCCAVPSCPVDRAGCGDGGC